MVVSENSAYWVGLLYLQVRSSQSQSHQEKCSKIIIDYKAVMKVGMTGISCNRLSEVDIGYNPIIIVLQYSQFIVTIVIFSLIVLVIITLQFYYHVPPFLLGQVPVTK